ncbi:hypothetical protein HK102_003309, partial [Quaeritorhiza haematococci]
SAEVDASGGTGGENGVNGVRHASLLTTDADKKPLNAVVEEENPSFNTNTTALSIDIEHGSSASFGVGSKKRGWDETAFSDFSEVKSRGRGEDDGVEAMSLDDEEEGSNEDASDDDEERAGEDQDLGSDDEEEDVEEEDGARREGESPRRRRFGGELPRELVVLLDTNAGTGVSSSSSGAAAGVGGAGSSESQSARWWSRLAKGSSKLRIDEAEGLKRSPKSSRASTSPPPGVGLLPRILSDGEANGNGTGSEAGGSLERRRDKKERDEARASVSSSVSSVSSGASVSRGFMNKGFKKLRVERLNLWAREEKEGKQGLCLESEQVGQSPGSEVEGSEGDAQQVDGSSLPEGGEGDASTGTEASGETSMFVGDSSVGTEAGRTVIGKASDAEGDALAEHARSKRVSLPPPPVPPKDPEYTWVQQSESEEKPEEATSEEVQGSRESVSIPIEEKVTEPQESGAEGISPLPKGEEETDKAAGVDEDTTAATTTAASDTQPTMTQTAEEDEIPSWPLLTTDDTHAQNDQDDPISDSPTSPVDKIHALVAEPEALHNSELSGTHPGHDTSNTLSSPPLTTAIGATTALDTPSPPIPSSQQQGVPTTPLSTQLQMQTNPLAGIATLVAQRRYGKEWVLQQQKRRSLNLVGEELNVPEGVLEAESGSEASGNVGEWRASMIEVLEGGEGEKEEMERGGVQGEVGGVGGGLLSIKMPASLGGIPPTPLNSPVAPFANPGMFGVQGHELYNPVAAAFIQERLLGASVSKGVEGEVQGDTGMVAARSESPSSSFANVKNENSGAADMENDDQPIESSYAPSTPSPPAESPVEVSSSQAPHQQQQTLTFGDGSSSAPPSVLVSVASLRATSADDVRIGSVSREDGSGVDVVGGVATLERKSTGGDEAGRRKKKGWMRGVGKIRERWRALMSDLKGKKKKE